MFLGPGGGIGIRGGLKIRSRKGYEFESRPGYHYLDKISKVCYN